AAGLAKQKWPEHLVITDEPLPRTPSGKVRKPDVKAKLQTSG
ncbi:MAG: hypothetical protein JWR83_344, partial [Aeromicrobium sp.]|nr:hypothetical protein [Aeromicrobium sp.]